MHNYRPQRSCGQGNVFTGVWDSVHGGGGCLPQCMLGYHTPLEQRSTPWVDPPRSRHPQDQTPPRNRHYPPWSRHPPRAETHPQEQTPLEQTPQTRHTPPPTADPPGADTPPQEQTPGADTPPGDRPPGAPPPRSRLLACILVPQIYSLRYDNIGLSQPASCH